MRLLILLAAVAIAVAGCVQPVDEGDADAASLPLPEFLDPIVDEHDHASFEEHNHSTPNMHFIAHTTLNVEEPSKALSYLGEMDTHGNLTVVQVLGRGSMPGFVVVDVSDPANPTPIGRGEMPFSYVVDVKFSPDGRYVFAASQAGAQRQRAHSPLTDDPGNALVQGNGFTQFDMADPTNPVAIAGGLVEPAGCHMLSVKEIGGTLTVFCVGDAILVFEYTTSGAWMHVGTVAPDTSAMDRVLAETTAAGTGAPNQLLQSATPHDITVQQDPLDESRWLALVSYWDLGLMIYDVTDTRNPQLLSAWAGAGAEVYEGNVHGAMLVAHDGKRLAVVGPELLGQTVPSLWVLDASDLAAPTLIAEWVPPGAHVTQGLLLTVHQFQVVGGRIYMAYNHAGLWVLDLQGILDGVMSDPARPEVLGVYMPHEEVELFDPDVAAVPNTWDVNVMGGYILASDRYTGFYVLHLADDPRGDPAWTSFA